MPTLHDPAVHTTLRNRIVSLTPDAKAKWGKMSVDQMLWHVNGGLEMALGRLPAKTLRTPLPRSVMRFLVLSLPWPKSAPTIPEIAAKRGSQYDFSVERQRLVSLLDEMHSRDINGAWPTHAVFGQMQGRHWSTLHARHVHYHLTQFNA
jgi:hypothetical protein